MAPIVLSRLVYLVGYILPRGVITRRACFHRSRSTMRPFTGPIAVQILVVPTRYAYLVAVGFDPLNDDAVVIIAHRVAKVVDAHLIAGCLVVAFIFSVA